MDMFQLLFISTTAAFSPIGLANVGPIITLTLLKIHFCFLTADGDSLFESSFSFLTTVTEL